MAVYLHVESKHFLGLIREAGLRCAPCATYRGLEGGTVEELHMKASLNFSARSRSEACSSIRGWGASAPRFFGVQMASMGFSGAARPRFRVHGEERGPYVTEQRDHSHSLALLPLLPLYWVIFRVV